MEEASPTRGRYYPSGPILACLRANQLYQSSGIACVKTYPDGRVEKK